MEQQQIPIVVLRWIAFLPAAFLGGWLAWIVVAWGNRITMGMTGVDSSSFLARVFIEFISHAALGAAFVYLGARVAPTHKKPVAYGLTAVGLLMAGGLLATAVMSATYWSVWAGLSMAAGLVGAAFAVNTGEMKL
jgi:hypothetical protein